MFNTQSRILTRALNFFLVSTFNIALLFSFSGNAVANTPPLSDAGPDQSVTENTTVQLDGSNSIDVDGQITSFRWLQTRGPSVSLSDRR